MNNSMVAHLWAHEQEESANGSNFYFEGESIYSYGRHFEIGRIVRNKRGEKAYLINDTYYSSTTSKHQYYVREAYQLAQRCSMLNVIYHIVSVTCSLLPICWNPLKMLLKNTRKPEPNCLIGMFGGILKILWIILSSLIWKLPNVFLKRAQTNGLELTMNYHINQIRLNVSMSVN